MSIYNKNKNVAFIKCDILIITCYKCGACAPCRDTTILFIYNISL